MLKMLRSSKKFRGFVTQELSPRGMRRLRRLGCTIVPVQDIHGRRVYWSVYKVR